MLNKGAKVDEKRSWVRGTFPYKVKFRILSHEQYETFKKPDSLSLYQKRKRIKLEVNSADIKEIENSHSTGLVNFLLYLDEKLELILSLLAGKDGSSEYVQHGVGLNISASGMKIMVDSPVESKQKIHANIILSSIPFVCFDAFGEIVTVKPVNEEGKIVYHLGVKFIDLDSNDREEIIACVIQKERKAIRKSKLSDLS